MFSKFEFQKSVKINLNSLRKLINFTDMTHVTNDEIEKVKKLIEVLQMRQSLLSETTLVSEDALCTICYARQNGKELSFIDH